MNDTNKNKVMMSVLLERMAKRRLPRLIDIREKLGENKKLDRYDIEFLEKVFRETQENQHFIENAEEQLKTICLKIMSLYKEITEKALENENKAKT